MLPIFTPSFCIGDPSSTATPEATEAIRSFRAHPDVLKLKGAVQHYDWGGCDFIPHLLRTENRTSEPFAELWLGAHPKAPATAVIGPVSLPLDQLMGAAGEEILGPAAVRFGNRLPYLLKVLDVGQMVSLQAHPTKRQAEEGFARENSAGIPLSAPHRNYRDDHHKPEMHVALTELWMLHGFRPGEEIAQIPSTVPELGPILAEGERFLAGTGAPSESSRKRLRELFNRLMTQPQEEVDGVLDPLLERLQRERPKDKNNPDFWALRAGEGFPHPGGHRDRGILSIYLLNLVHLQPGQGTFQPAGTLHSFLEGATVELMANSDNVLRGGLTSKHADVPELLQTLTFQSGPPEVLTGAPLSATERVYRTPTEEFQLSRIEVGPGRSHAGKAASGPEIWLLVEGSVGVRTDCQTLPLERGEAFLVPSRIGYLLEAQTPVSILFKAAIPAPRRKN